MYEVEYKIQLKNDLGAINRYLQKLAALGRLEYSGYEEQINHYFQGVDLNKLDAEFVKKNKIKIVENPNIRTREINKKERYIVIKSGGANDSARYEQSIRVKSEIGINAVDAILMQAGGAYHSKWSRTRATYILTQYASKTVGEQTRDWEIFVTIDFNSGYGYLSELELCCDNKEEVKLAVTILDTLCERLGVTPINPKKLDNMYRYYVAHWGQFYTTKRVFSDLTAAEWCNRQDKTKKLKYRHE